MHLIASTLADLSAEFATVGQRDLAGAGDILDPAPPTSRMPAPKVMVDPHQHIDEIRVMTRDFR